MANCSTSVDLTQKIDFLSSPDSYGPGTQRVETRETHMSWVFLTEDRVFKLKKPVRHTFLDFSSIAKRRFFCEEELRLNRRLAPETYRRVLPLRRDACGRLQLDGESRIVDWLVEMKRLRQADMLDQRIRHGHVGPDEIARVAAILAGFYKSRRPEFADGTAYLDHLFEEQRINRSFLLRPQFAFADLASSPLDKVDQLLVCLKPQIEARIAAGAIVEGHGDLRPEHVCLCEPPQIIDCLEFNRSMRIIDPYDEINYLGLECEMIGAAWIRPLLNSTLREQFHLSPSPELLALYGGFRALLRARLSIVHLLDKPIRHPEKWRPLALRYIRQAARECLNLPSSEARRLTHAGGAV